MGGIFLDQSDFPKDFNSNAVRNMAEWCDKANMEVAVL
jgi:hypothetical protein